MDFFCNLDCALNVIVQSHFALLLQKIQELALAYSRNVESVHTYT
jgi:hypothetical protein